jgi:methyltransferase (TIGR00027 family)
MAAMTADKASSTAFTILRSLTMQARDPQRQILFPPDWSDAHDKILRAADPGAARWLWQSDLPAFRRFMYGLEKRLLPGVQLHYILRKRFIEDVARWRIANGCTQVVNIAAGFDSLCYRLHHEFPAVNFFELDHPGTQAVKRRALEAIGINHSLLLLPVDLRRATLADTLLAEPAYDRTARTLFIAEGLLMYLDARNVAALFETVSQHSGFCSGIVFTFIESIEGVGGGSRLLRWWLRNRSEPFIWGINHMVLPSFLSEFRLDIDELADAGALRERYLIPAGLDALRSSPGELIAAATLR